MIENWIAILLPGRSIYKLCKQQIPDFLTIRPTINTFRSGFDAYLEIVYFRRVRMVWQRAERNPAVEADLHDVEVIVVA